MQRRPGVVEVGDDRLELTALAGIRLDGVTLLGEEDRGRSQEDDPVLAPQPVRVALDHPRDHVDVRNDRGALGLLALAEYRIASGDDRFDEAARQVADFLVSMQKEDGFFYHDWYPERGIDRELMKLYASQQAVFALARYAKAVGDQDALARAARL